MDNRPDKILVIDDEESIRYTFGTFLRREGHDVYEAADYEEAVSHISANDFSLIFADIVLRGKKGIDILKYMNERGINTPVIMITGQPEIETAAAAVRLGAFNYLTKPVTKGTLLSVTDYALNYKKLRDINKIIETEKDRYRKNLDAIFGSVKDGIITIDNDFNVVEANKAVESICNLPPSELKGLNLEKFDPHCTGGCILLLKKTLMEKKDTDNLRLECKTIKNPDQIVMVSSSCLPGDSGALLVIRDITKESRLENQLGIIHSKEIVGNSRKMDRVFNLISSLAFTDTTVLITGESGTGKELVAKALHSSGDKGKSPLVIVNCSALSENILESELFGHVKGAFTGALKDKKGRFALADGGTIFLDEIGDISGKIQLKLLRFLQEKEFEPVGCHGTIKVDVRVIAATNRDLKEKVKKGEFREDLYYRLNVVNIEIPPLRQRKEDIPLLFDHFKKKFNIKMEKKVSILSSKALKHLMEYNWPGNVRELEHVIEHSFVLTKGEMILPEHLPHEVRVKKEMVFNGADSEKDSILKALEKTDWNKAKAARILGFSRTTLYRKIADLGISE